MSPASGPICIDSAGNTIDFLLPPRRDFAAARVFLQLAVAQAGRIQPRVINVDGHPVNRAAIQDVKRSGEPKGARSKQGMSATRI